MSTENQLKARIVEYTRHKSVIWTTDYVPFPITERLNAFQKANGSPRRHPLVLYDPTGRAIDSRIHVPSQTKIVVLYTERLEGCGTPAKKLGDVLNDYERFILTSEFVQKARNPATRHLDPVHTIADYVPDFVLSPASATKRTYDTLRTFSGIAAFFIQRPALPPPQPPLSEEQRLRSLSLAKVIERDKERFRQAQLDRQRDQEKIEAYIKAAQNQAVQPDKKPMYKEPGPGKRFSFYHPEGEEDEWGPLEPTREELEDQEADAKLASACDPYSLRYIARPADPEAARAERFQRRWAEYWKNPPRWNGPE